MFNYDKNMNAEWDLSAVSAAQYMFWDKFLNEMAEKQFENNRLDALEQGEINDLFGFKDYFCGFPVYG